MLIQRSNLSAILLLGAIIVSGVLIPAYDYLPLRTLNLIPGGNITLFADSSGTTTAQWLDQETHSFRCTYNDKQAAARYCGLDVSLGESSSQGVDLSMYETIHLEMTYSGEAKVLRLYARHAMENVGDTAGGTIYKYNNVLLPVNDIQEALDIKFSQFIVAEWWLRTARLPWKDSFPDVSNATNIGIDAPTPTAMGDHDFTIKKLTLSGNFISRENWYLCIMGFWFVYLVAQVYFRFQYLHQQARASRMTMLSALEQSEQFKQESLRYKEQSLVDPLTKIYNRRGIAHACENQLNITGLPACAIMADLDHFKKINDEYGHDMGDSVLTGVADVLQRSTRITDLVGRWGGEEFVILCSNTTTEQAYHLTEHLRRAVTDFCNIPGGRPVTASFGIAEIIDGDIENAVNHADQALYDAKRQGRNCSCVYTGEAQTEEK